MVFLIFGIGILLILIWLSGYFSSLETAFVSIDSLKLKQIVEEKRKNSLDLKYIKDNNHKMLITILICNNLVNISASAIATLFTTRFFGSAFIGLTTGLLTLLILVFGEITPKAYATQKNVYLALKNAKKLRIFMFLLSPLIFVLDIVTNFLLKLKGIKVSPENSQVTEETLKKIVTISEKDGEINSIEKEMIHNIFEFNDTLVKNIMTPRTDMFALDLNDDTELNITKAIKSGFSRIPFFNRKIDTIIGILYLRDLLKLLHDRDKVITKKDLKEILRTPYFVPETKKIDSLFKQFKNKKTHIALVVDEYGGISGLVTIEDLLEEIVGDIYDETDEEEFKYKKLSDKEYLVDGNLEIDELSKLIDVNFSDDDNYDTLSGLIFDKLERIPKKDEIVKFKHFVAKIENIKNNRIELVKIKKIK